MHKVLERAIGSADLNYLEMVFNTHPHYTTRGMEKLSLPLGDAVFSQWVKELIEKRIGITEPYTIVGDNFYKHNHSYFPHCDAVEENAWMNIVIPIHQWYRFGDQKFIVFDQTWAGRNATWMGNFEFEGDFDSNKKRTQRPCDDEFFQGGTGQPLPDEIWNHLDKKYFTQDYFHSMSGTAYDWVPGNIILFDSNHIHATGRMQSTFKLGISIRTARV